LKNGISGDTAMATYAMTGGATGIGAALKQQLRDRGDTVIVVDIQAGDVIADLATAQGRQAAVDGIRAAAPGGLDGFIPCAGLGPHVKPHSLVAKVNYFGVIATIEGVRDLVAMKQGTILLVSSNSAPMIDKQEEFVSLCLAGDEAAACACVDGRDGHTAYAGSKRAITTWMRQHVVEYAQSGVRLNAVAPGITLTPLTDKGFEDEEFGQSMRDFSAATPVGYAAQPDHIANVMRFLLSADAAFICGAILFVDGGMDALLRPEEF
jgi:NAD(P)-dependent dehydrogenase (short-subunit alcohol dehydrogenase family)